MGTGIGSWNGKLEWEHGIGRGTGNGNGERGSLNLYFLSTAMTEVCNKMHFTLFRGQSKTVSKILIDLMQITK